MVSHQRCKLVAMTTQSIQRLCDGINFQNLSSCFFVVGKKGGLAGCWLAAEPGCQPASLTHDGSRDDKAQRKISHQIWYWSSTGFTNKELYLWKNTKDRKVLFSSPYLNRTRCLDWAAHQQQRKHLVNFGLLSPMLPCQFL